MLVAKLYDWIASICGKMYMHLIISNVKGSGKHTYVYRSLAFAAKLHSKGMKEFVTFPLCLMHESFHFFSPSLLLILFSYPTVPQLQANKEN